MARSTFKKALIIGILCIATFIVAAAMDSFGWNFVFTLWSFIGIIGLVATFIKYKKRCAQ